MSEVKTKKEWQFIKHALRTESFKQALINSDFLAFLVSQQNPKKSEFNYRISDESFKFKLRSLSGQFNYTYQRMNYLTITYSSKALKIMAELCPPNPKVLLKATFTSRSCAWLKVRFILGSISGSSLK